MSTVTASARRASGRRKDLIDLSGEDLGLPTPPHVREAAKRALDEGATHYTTRPGLDPLRGAVAEKLRRDNGIAVNPKTEVVITCGSREALFVALHVLLDKGDELLIPEPARPAYVEVAHMAGASVRAIPGNPTAGFALDAGEIARRLTPRTRALVLASPTIPVGVVPDSASLRGVADLARDANLVVVSDETYEVFTEDRRHQSIGSLPDMVGRTVTISSFSAPYGMRGWRAGYMAGPEHLLGPIQQLKQALSICSPAVSQYAALAAITGPQEAWHEARSTIARRRVAAMRALERTGIRYARAEAGPFLLVHAPAGSPRGASLAQRVARQSGVLLAPGSRFGACTSSWLRLTLSKRAEVLEDAIRRLGPTLGEDRKDYDG